MSLVHKIDNFERLMPRSKSQGKQKQGERVFAEIAGTKGTLRRSPLCQAENSIFTYQLLLLTEQSKLVQRKQVIDILYSLHTFVNIRFLIADT